MGSKQVKELSKKIGNLEEELPEATVNKDPEKVKGLDCQLFLQ
ncbi:MAG: hypothetical protein ABGW77_00500 [Campylobacterales bacterium]